MSSSRRVLSSWKKLESFVPTLRQTHLHDWFDNDPERFTKFSVEDEGCLLDYSKHWINAPIWEALLALAHECNVPSRLEELCTGAIVNTTEGNAAFHTALRNFTQEPLHVKGYDFRPEIETERQRMLTLADQLHTSQYLGSTGKSITHVVNIGIGGSDLGPRAVLDALPSYQNPLAPEILTLSSIDGDRLSAVLASLDPERTLFLFVSKSLGTEETRLNSERARRWASLSLGEEKAAQHFFAITANPDGAMNFNIPPERCLKLWPWVGGRYSLWSSVGLCIAIRLGSSAFLELLRGAHSMDMHARTAPLERNMPAILALLGVWYRNFLGFSTHAVIPYPERLNTFVSHLQQVDMESNGKRVDLNGNPLDLLTTPIIWGSPGNQGQHAYFQLLHQGTQPTSIDFILEATPHHTDQDLHRRFLANALAQSQALMAGTAPEDDLPEYKRCPGGQPSTVVFFEHLTPFNMGRLLALYEHKVAIQGIIWNVDSFDQWGVALGKKLANRLTPLMLPGQDISSEDASTQGLLRFFLKFQPRS